jgi:hypothetical protein
VQYKVVDFAASTLMSASAGILSTPFLPRTAIWLQGHHFQVDAKVSLLQSLSGCKLL